MKALVIDDSKVMRTILKRILNDFHFDVIEASNGRQALEALERFGEFALALVDWRMPEMDGYEFVCAVRANSAYENMPMMMVTTETEMNQVIKALAAGADEYLMKPFTRDVIHEKLQILGLIDSSQCAS